MEKIYRVQMNSSGMPNFATAEEIPQGEWIRVSADKYVQHAHHFYRCSFCREDVIGKHNFCPNCGADMRERKESE